MVTPAPAPKAKKRIFVKDQDLLMKLVSILEKERLTKEQLAAKLELDSPKQINDSLLLAAIKLAGNSGFLSNIIEKTDGRRAKKGLQYSEKKGLVIPAWIFDGKEIANGQKYIMKFGKKGIITLRPIADEESGKE